VSHRARIVLLVLTTTVVLAIALELAALTDRVLIVGGRRHATTAVPAGRPRRSS
jgi:hypothetical protein